LAFGLQMLISSTDGLTRISYVLTVTRQLAPSLASLSIEGFAISPTFAGGVLQYSASLQTAITSVTVIATPVLNPAVDSLVIGGIEATTSKQAAVSVQLGANVVQIILIGPSGFRTYTLNIDRASFPALSSLVFGSGNLDPSFDTVRLAYVLRSSQASVVVKAVASQSLLSVTINSGAAGVGSQTATLTVLEGQATTAITIVVSDNLGSNQSYSIITDRPAEVQVTRLDLVDSTGALIQPTNVPDVAGLATSTAQARYIVRVSSGVASSQFRLAAVPTGSTVVETAAALGTFNANGVAISAAANLNEGSNTFTFAVTSPLALGGLTVNLYVDVIRNNLPRLTSLLLSTGTLVPIFEPTRFSYTLTVTAGQTETSLTLTVPAGGSEQVYSRCLSCYW
jgi:hypothetical protein